ncbi:kinase-like protein [Calocera cornea HHB12733]|uniref:Kinase-like protein n=1 Tax=Calocera cornea HHB12733 TaxID=1353952 RepID=A0A165GKQ8_9BASI|nr:kinase-like protein [Calocera cornea HHB12733]
MLCIACEVRRLPCVFQPHHSTCYLCETWGIHCDVQGRIGLHILALFPKALQVDIKLPLREVDHVAGGLLRGCVQAPIAHILVEGYRRNDCGQAPPLLSARPAQGALRGSGYPSTYATADRIQRALREALTWSLLDHENIIPLLGIACDRPSQRLFLVSEWMAQGNIRQHLEAHPEADRTNFVEGMAMGLQYLHELVPPIAHGDIKGNNVLLTATLRPLLSDFGLSSVLEPVPSLGSSSSVSGNARWCAPERLMPEEYGLTMRSCVTLGGDVFSLLRTFLEILTNAPPFSDCANDYYVIQRVMARLHPARPACAPLSDRLWELMSFARSQGPFGRPSAGKVVHYRSRPATSPGVHWRRKRPAIASRSPQLPAGRADARLHQHAKRGGRERTYYVMNPDVELSQAPRNAGARVGGPRRMVGPPAPPTPPSTPLAGGAFDWGGLSASVWEEDGEER